VADECAFQLRLISKFIGMLTDSRSFMSYPRHEYFRRVLCDLFGKDMEAGEIPNDESMVGPMVRDICYNNAHRFPGFGGLAQAGQVQIT
jgi:glucuronate isomerase